MCCWLKFIVCVCWSLFVARCVLLAGVASLLSFEAWLVVGGCSCFG